MDSKAFKTVDEQIEILKSRGMIIKDYDKCKRYLLTNNYYNIINGYSKYFQDSSALSNEKYISGVSFDEVCQLYSFDIEIKQTMLRSILNAEHHLKAIFAYRFAEAYPRKRYPYLDINCYSREKTLDVGYSISKIERIINKNKRYNNNSIYHYVRHYNDVPIWVIVDFLDFGDLDTLITCLPLQLQNKIAMDLLSFIKDNIPSFSGQFTPEIMISLIKNIHETRNVCAHNNRLLDFRCRSDSMYLPQLHDEYDISSNDLRRQTFSTFVSMQCFLSKMEFRVLNNTLRKKFKNLSNKLTTIDITDISCLLGFPDGWHEKDKMVQSSPSK